MPAFSSTAIGFPSRDKAMETRKNQTATTLFSQQLEAHRSTRPYCFLTLKERITSPGEPQQAGHGGGCIPGCLNSLQGRLSFFTW